jgi:hypothetical protein
VTPEGERWLTAYGAALAARRFARVVVDPDFPAFFLRDVPLDNAYVAAGPLPPAGDEYWRLRSARIPRADLYAPTSAR